MSQISQRGKIRAASYLAAAFVILAGYCITGYQAALSYQRIIANGYLRAFSQVVASVDRLDSALQKELYVVSPGMIGLLSAEVQTEAATAQEALGELPYANIELEQTAAFLSRVGDRASALARSAAADGALSETDQQDLEALAQAASVLRERLDALESQLNEGELTLDTAQAVEQRLAELSEGDTLLAGSAYENVETNFPELPTMTYDGPFSDHLASSAPKVLEGLGQVSVEEAIAAAANCTGYRASIFQYEGDVEGEIPCYTLSASVDGGTLSVEVTKAGGIVLELNQSRSVTETKLSPQEGVQQAQAFLARCGYRDMVETYYCQSDGRLTVNFAWQQGEVLCYPDLCSVTVALDTGSILGYECTSYVSNHTQRELETPAITVDEARQMVSPRLEILRAQLALIPTDGEYEVLCWEFVCASETGQHYIVCINAETGAEQKILILLEDENGTLAI
jgi:germination protein YpeB